MKKLKFKYLSVIPDQKMVITIRSAGIFAHGLRILFITTALAICLPLSIINAQYLHIDNTDKSTYPENKNLSLETYGYAKLFDFYKTNNGSHPTELILSDNYLYGVTFNGGEYGINGILYKIRTDGNHFTNLGATLTNPNSLTISDSVLYGTMNDSYGDGHIYRININGTGYKNIFSFNDVELPIYNIKASGDAIYGIEYGKYNGLSYFFKINSDGSNFQKFQSVGDFPYGKILAIEDYLYGTTAGPTGSTNNLGSVYKIKTDGTGFKELHRFTNSQTGDSPLASLTIVGSKLYGSTKKGGLIDCGIIFKIDLDGTNFEIIHHFSFEEGVGTRSKLVYSENSLYGAAYSGGLYSDHGTLFKINLDGSGFQKLYDFQGIDGSRPVDLAISGDTIWGITKYGGINDDGVLYRFTLEKSNESLTDPPKVIKLAIERPEQVTLTTKENLVVESGKSIDLDTTFSATGNIQYTYSWQVKTTTGYNIIDNVAKITSDSTFYIFLTTTQGCSYLDSLIVEAQSSTSISDIDFNNQIHIYPNPNTGEFQITILGDNANYSYEIFDIVGKKIADGRIICTTGECIHNINLSDAQPGLYTLVISKDQEFFGQKKFIISY